MIDAGAESRRGDGRTSLPGGRERPRAMLAATCVGATRSFAVSHERGASSGTAPGALRGAELRGRRPKGAPLRGRLPAPRPGDAAQPRASARPQVGGRWCGPAQQVGALCAGPN